MKIDVVSFNNTFCEYLCSYVWFDLERMMSMMERYPIGATEQEDPIFWHMDAQKRITDGRILTTDRKTGKVYDCSWYYHDGRPVCLFGENLLGDFPEKTVALVKDETTAAIMSCFPTPYIWLATGKAEVTSSDLRPLEGRTVVVFPDKGEAGLWSEALRTTPNLRFYVSEVMERSDLMCRNIAEGVLREQELRPTEEEKEMMEMRHENPAIDKLFMSFDLELVSTDWKDMGQPLPKPEPEEKRKKRFRYEAYDAQTIKEEQRKRWHGRNPQCHECEFSHESVNGTFCDKLNKYVEHGKGDCGR